MNDPVDVLIIGAGASGAAVAWSLAETKMHILCLEQGGWMNPATFPSTGRDWEARAFGDYSPSPNIRGRPEDYPINDDNSPIKVVNFNGVGGGTVMYTAHFPRLHPSRGGGGGRDGWGGVKNLSFDGSLFVTSGGVNPTSTIQAVALYIADQMKQRLADLFD